MSGELKVIERDGTWNWVWTLRGTTSRGPGGFDTKAKALAAGRRHAKRWGQ